MIALALLMVGLCSVFSYAAVATESTNGHVTADTSVGHDVVAGSGERDLGRELLPQHEVRIENEVLCLALNIYFEARGEPEKGQLAVAHVVMNRVADRHYPSTACNVVQQGGEDRLYRCQFSWWCDGRSDTPLNQKAWLKSVQLAIKVYFGLSEDPTEGALWYHADYANPYWNDSLVLGSKIGQHIFYIKKRQPKYVNLNGLVVSVQYSTQSRQRIAQLIQLFPVDLHLRKSDYIRLAFCLFSRCNAVPSMAFLTRSNVITDRKIYSFNS